MNCSFYSSCTAFPSEWGFISVRSMNIDDRPTSHFGRKISMVTYLCNISLHATRYLIHERCTATILCPRALYITVYTYDGRLETYLLIDDS